MNQGTGPGDSSHWPEAIFDVLRDAGVTQVAYVPDAGHARLIELCLADDTMQGVALTSEEEGVALLAGAWLGGARGVLLMQSSGVGNCINMLSMVQECAETVAAAAKLAFNAFRAVAVSVSQRVIGSKEWK